MYVQRTSTQQYEDRQAEHAVSDVQAGTVTVKGSPSRNLHRLLSSISFIALLLQNLGSDPKCTLHTAAANAYNASMSPMHNFVVRTAVKASMYTLPSREQFLASIGETGVCMQKSATRRPLQYCFPSAMHHQEPAWVLRCMHEAIVSWTKHTLSHSGKMSCVKVVNKVFAL